MPDETVIAFDFGLKRIGIAIGERRLGAARALATIAAADNDRRFAEIEGLIAEWHPARLVVGRPANDDGSAHEMTARCERFANQLRGRFRLPVEEVDERYTSLAAEAALREAGADWRTRRGQVDAEAARLILQDWLEAHAA